MAVYIGSNEFQTYSSNEEALQYLSASISEQATTFLAATEDTQNKALVEATRVFDRQTWKDAYDTFDERAAVEAIVNASIEYAALLVNGDTESLSSPSVNSGQQKRIKAGSVELENFKTLSSDPGARNRFPLQVQELLKPYLASASGIQGGYNNGVSRETAIATYDVSDPI